MVKEVKKGLLGQASKYISRAKAIRKLQLPLSDFKKLCILKGVYPREPVQSLKKTNKVFYHKKDINFLAADPMVQYFSYQKSFERKYKHFMARNEKADARSLLINKQDRPDLSYLLKERYPRFEDALNDLQDALCMVSLYASFQCRKQLEIDSQAIEDSARVLKEWQLLVITNHNLKKAFLSIKGIYYQAEIQGIKIHWLVPYRYPQKLPLEVDYRVFNTFLESYLVMLRFVMFRLFSKLDIAYPLHVNLTQAKFMGNSLKSLELKRTRNIETALAEQKYALDAELVQVQQKHLFQGLVFYLSNETPRDSLEFILMAKGAVVSMRPEPVPSDCTHYVSEREEQPAGQACEYVQPQWVYDSINRDKLLSCGRYRPGVALPPHLSPWDEDVEVDSDQDDPVVQEKKEMAKSVLSRKQRSELRRLEIKDRPKRERARAVKRKRQALGKDKAQ